jgi:Protein of unknown function (DUF2637)
VVIDGTIVVALLTVLAAKRAAARAGYPWVLARLFSAASVAFNIAHAPDRPVARLVFAMAPVALVLTTHLLMQQAGWRPTTPGRSAPAMPAHRAGPEPAHPHRPGEHAKPEQASQDRSAPVGARARVRAAYDAQVAAGQTPTGRRPGPSRRRQRAVRATPPRRVHRRPDPRQPPNGGGPAYSHGQQYDPTTTEGR